MSKRSGFLIIVTLLVIVILLVMPSVLEIDISAGSLTIGLSEHVMSSMHAPAALQTAAEEPLEILATPMPPQEALPTPEPSPEPTPEPTPTPDPYTTITITFAGDTTLGGEYGGNSYRQFMNFFDEIEGDYEFYLRNFRDIFEADDLTILNFEGTLTELTNGRRERFNFRGPPHLIEVLTSSSVEVVSLANNHINDFGAAGYKDTVDVLNEAGIRYFGNAHSIFKIDDIDYYTIVEVKGIKIGLFGFLAWEGWGDFIKHTTHAVEALQAEGADLIIGYHHWGHELHFEPERLQKEVGRHAIDIGAHLIVGSHPHVIQGIEEYKGRNIVYSLGNFAFGGTAYPTHLDCIVFQQTFTFYNGELVDDNVTNVIPTLSSSRGRPSNYQPTPAEGANAERILDLLERLSSDLNR